jgi:hypothetical protein
MAAMRNVGYCVALHATGGMLMNVQWSNLTSSQQEALRYFSTGQRSQVQRKTEEQLRNLGLAERDGIGAKISKIGFHLLSGH